MIRVKLQSSDGGVVAGGVLDEGRVEKASSLIFRGKHYTYGGMAGGWLIFREVVGEAWDVTEEFP